MMTALLSDIHGNSVALRAVLEDVRARGVAQLVIAGDFLGYYYRAEEVFTLLAEWEWVGVRGNHDAIFLEEDVGVREQYRRRYGHALDVAQEKLPIAVRHLLHALPETRIVERDHRRVFVCHGAPWRGDAYVYPNADANAFERIASLGHDVVVLGHTHYPLVRRAGKTLIVNPGSVGQPRDEGGVASWALLDTHTMSAEVRRVPFDAGSVIADVAQYDAAMPYLTQVLTRKQRVYE